jgi:hypothetical protein
MKWLAIAALLGACVLSPAPYDKPANIAGCMALAVAQCTMHDGCTDGFQSARVYGTPELCVARTMLPCVNSSQIRDTGQTPDQLATCTSQTAAADCSTYFENNPPPGCNAAGPDGTGTPCGTDNECKTGYCRIDTDAICGVCAAKPLIGATCVGGDCGRDLGCAKAATSSTGMCAAWVEEGDPCPDVLHPCAPTLTCYAGTCTKARLEGMTCDGMNISAPMCNSQLGLSCIASTCVKNTHVHAGESCGAFAGAVATCVAGATCIKASVTDLAGVCMGPAADGAACNDDPTIGPPCLTPAKCVAGVCTVPDSRTCRMH